MLARLENPDDADKTEKDEAEAAEKRRKEKERREKQAEARKRVKVFTTGDRLLEDKVYLSMLAEGGIGMRADLTEDTIKEDVAYEAKEALEFLNSREKFWDQLDLNSEHKKNSKKDTHSLESLRWLM